MCEVYEKLVYDAWIKCEEMMEKDKFNDNPYHTPSAQKSYDAKIVFKTGKGRCLDCERHEHLSRLRDIPNTELRDALIWILENTDYPIGE